MAKKTTERQNHTNYRRVFEIDREIASGRYPNVRYFMKKFEVSEATVLRDIDRLRYDFGAEIEYDRIRKGYYYTTPSFRLPALLSTEKQIVAAQLMSNLLATIKGTPIYNQAIEVSYKKCHLRNFNFLNGIFSDCECAGAVYFQFAKQIEVKNTRDILAGVFKRLPRFRITSTQTKI